jgi:hypothetical protein
VLNEKMLRILFTLFLSFDATTGFASSCISKKFDRRSQEYLKNVYDNASLVGVFELFEIGPRRRGPVAGRYQILLKLRPIRLIKGKVAGVHVHDYMAIDNNLALPFELNEKYLFAFEKRRDKYFFVKPPNDPDATINQMCDWPFQAKLKESDFFEKKFLEIKKTEAVGSP